MVEISNTFGLWERSLIAWPDGRRDTTTYVGWLQGPTLFADLRQPVDPPPFEGVSCLDDLGPEHFGWLARQEGFAGRFVRLGDAFEWQRIIDFQCTSIYSDVGYLGFQGDILVETGRDVAYVEHWHRTSLDFVPHYALRMMDQTGRLGFIIRAGAIFMYVRDRVKPLAFDASLPDLVTSSAPKEARGLLNCEISLGRMQGDAWIIERSSLPYRVGRDISATFSSDRTSVWVADVTDDGKPFTQHWTIVSLDNSAPNTAI
ncbi:MAG TPA: hypothetical protein PKE16_05210 [Hyphomicrobium sp.]|nr:hypothetical protein [Hyphomicrobium sp.]